MNRRNVLKTGIAASLVGVADLPGKAMAETPNHYYELRTYELRLTTWGCRGKRCDCSRGRRADRGFWRGAAVPRF